MSTTKVVTGRMRNVLGKSVLVQPAVPADGWTPRETMSTLTRLPQTSTCTCTSSSLVRAGTLSVASPSASAVADTGVPPFIVSSIVDPGGALRTMTVCASAARAVAIAMRAAVSTSDGKRFRVLCIPSGTDMSLGIMVQQERMCHPRGRHDAACRPPFARLTAAIRPVDLPGVVPHERSEIIAQAFTGGAVARCPFAQWDEISGSAGTYLGGPFKIVHHTTEGSTYAGARAAYVAKRVDPHFTVFGEQVFQHIDTSVAARSLRNPPGGVETNRDSAVQ